MKRAIVLSGGGAKGAYQIGFWKAIRELDIEYDIVTGTSIGALNGAFMVQGNYNDAFKLWYNMNYNQVIEGGLDASYYDKGRRKVILKYAKGAVKGGLSVPGLEKIIDDNLKPDLFYSSKVDYGLVTVKFPSLKPVMLTKNKISKELLPDYLLASASCFPAFKMKEINKESYIDGGYYDNMPIELAISMGADEIIGVDLRAPGRRKKIKDTNVPITTISSKNDIGNFLVLEKRQTRRSIRLGYNDTMKAFGDLEGGFFTFRKGSLKRNFNKLKNNFYKSASVYLNRTKKNKMQDKLFSSGGEKYFNDVLENVMRVLSFDDTIIYRTGFVNFLIKEKYKKEKKSSYNIIKKTIKSGKLSKTFLDKELIFYIYNEMKSINPHNRILNNLHTLFPKSFMCAVYLKTIMR